MESEAAPDGAKLQLTRDAVPGIGGNATLLPSRAERDWGGEFHVEMSFHGLRPRFTEVKPLPGLSPNWNVAS